MKLKEYDEKGDPDEHIQHVNDHLNYLYANKATKCKLFTLTSTGSAQLWFKVLPNMSIDF